MEWWFFTTQHMITIILTLAAPFIFFFILKKFKPQTQDKLLFYFSFLGLFGILGNLWVGIKEDVLIWKLPFHLCSWTAMLLPIAAKTKNSKLCSTVAVWSIGALIAVILNDEAIHYKMFGIKWFIYFVPHLAEFCVPLLLLFLRKYKMKWIEMLWVWVGTATVYTISFMVSYVLGWYFKTDVNYLFTMHSTNFVTDFLYSLLPYKYWYMYTAFPLIALLTLGVYFKRR